MWVYRDAQDYGSRTVFGITALLPLLVSFAALLIDEAPVTGGYTLLSSSSAGPSPNPSVAGGAAGSSSGAGSALVPVGAAASGVGGGLQFGSSPAAYLKQQLVLLWRAVSKKEVLLPTVFIFLWQVRNRTQPDGSCF